MEARVKSVQDVVDDGYLLNLDAQRRLSALVSDGGPYEGRFDVDLAGGVLTFTGAQVLRVRAHFIGAAAPGPGSWLWGWHNVNGFPERTVEYAEHVRRFGELAGLTELTVAEHPLVRSPRDEAVTYATVASVVCGGLPHYTFDAGGGTVVALLLDGPELAPGPPSAVRAATLVPEALAAGVVVDWRRALASYAQMRGFGHATTASGVELSAPDGRVALTVDDLGRIVSVDAQLGAG